MKHNIFSLKKQGRRILQFIRASVWPVAPKKLEPVKIISPLQYGAGPAEKQQS
ncbi:MAG TPA: hypothetical protein PK339_01260 [Flavitalea sp.]|nr:hypothetical protein [Flavitalea sp.]